jgi:hypothetical protein
MFTAHPKTPVDAGRHPLTLKTWWRLCHFILTVFNNRNSIMLPFHFMRSLNMDVLFPILDVIDFEKVVVNVRRSRGQSSSGHLAPFMPNLCSLDSLLQLQWSCDSLSSGQSVIMM